VRLFRAYERVFFKCVDEVARLRGAKGEQVDTGKYEWMSGGIDGLPRGVLEADIILHLHADGMRLDEPEREPAGRRRR
jgi:hypothetical protein